MNIIELTKDLRKQAKDLLCQENLAPYAERNEQAADALEILSRESAAMRLALEYCKHFVQHEPYGTLFRLADVEQALQSDAGRDFVPKA